MPVRVVSRPSKSPVLCLFTPPAPDTRPPLTFSCPHSFAFSRITEDRALPDCPVPLSNKHLRFFPVSSWLGSSFLLSSGKCLSYTFSWGLGGNSLLWFLWCPSVLGGNFLPRCWPCQTKSPAAMLSHLLFTRVPLPGGCWGSVRHSCFTSPYSEIILHRQATSDS